MNTKVTNSVVKSFDPSHPNWTNDQDHNFVVVNALLNYCYDKLRSRGFLFLNEVYKELRIPMTRLGQKAGWIFNREIPIDQDIMWRVWVKDDGYDDVYITFKPMEDITDVLEEGL